MTAVEPKPTTPERDERDERDDAPAASEVSAPPVTRRRRETTWVLAGLAFLVGAVIVGASIGPAGPPGWRVPLALLDHLPLISIDSGVSDAGMTG